MQGELRFLLRFMIENKPMAIEGHHAIWENVRCFGVSAAETGAVLAKLRKAGLVAELDGNPGVWMVRLGWTLEQVEDRAKIEGVNLDLGLKDYLSKP